MPVRKWKRQATEWEKVFVLYLPEKGLTKSSYQEYIRNDKKIRKYRSSKWAKDLKDVLKKNGSQMVNTYMKKWSISLVIKEIKVKITVIYCHISIKMAKTEENTNDFW